MKILQINASYKPAYIYGGPTMSVAKLCEEISTHCLPDKQAFSLIERLKTGEGSGKAKVRSLKTKIESGFASAHLNVKLIVYTTLANGKEELPYLAGEEKIVDGVLVKYFKRLTKDHSHFSPSLLWHLWKTVKQYDVVHVHAWWNLVSVLSCWIAVLRGVPVLLTPRGTMSPYSFQQNQSFFKRIFHSFLGKPILSKLHYHLTSLKEKEDTMKLFSGKSFTMIPNFVQLSDNVTNHIDFTEGALRLLFFSRIEKKKGIELLFESLHEIGTPFHLTIAGSGDFDYIASLKILAAEKGIADCLTWLGQISPDVKFNIMASHHLLVLPSWDENFANVIIESLSVNTPVLISDMVGLAPYVLEHGLGWVSIRNSHSFKKQLFEIGNHRGLLAEIATHSRQQIMKDFEVNQLRNQYIQLYIKIIHESV